jgi:hypothetical protein
MYSTILCSVILYPTIDLKTRKKRKEVSVEWLKKVERSTSWSAFVEISKYADTISCN